MQSKFQMLLTNQGTVWLISFVEFGTVGAPTVSGLCLVLTVLTVQFDQTSRENLFWPKFAIVMPLIGALTLKKSGRKVDEN